MSWPPSTTVPTTPIPSKSTAPRQITWITSNKAWGILAGRTAMSRQDANGVASMSNTNNEASMAYPFSSIKLLTSSEFVFL